MKQWRPHTPMLWLLLPLAAGIAVASEFALSTLLAAIFLFVALLLLYLWRHIAPTYLIIFGFGAFLASLDAPPSDLEPQLGSTVALRVERGCYAQIVGLRCPDGQWCERSDKVLLWGAAGTAGAAGAAGSVSDGQSLIARANISKVDPSQSPYYRAMSHRGYRYRVQISEVLSSSPTQNLSIAQRLNEWGSARLERLALSHESSALCAAVVLARRTELDRATIENYNRSGGAHLLALSGLHLGVVVLIVSAATYYLPLLRNGHIVANLLSIVAIWLFTLMAGAGESVMRAAWMFTLLQLSQALSRSYSSLNALFVAAVMILCFDPAALYDLGFILSLTAVAAILVVGLPLVRRLSTGNPIADFVIASLTISVVATLATAPLVSHAFGYFTLLSPLVTLPLLLSVTIIILFTICWILCPLPSLAPLFRSVLEVSATLQNYLVEWFASLGYGFVDFRLSISGLYICYAAMIVIMALLVGRNPQTPNQIKFKRVD